MLPFFQIGTNKSAYEDSAGPNRAWNRCLSFLTIQRYDVFMAVAQDSLLYSRVETVLAREIADRVLKVGDQLPTEDILIARLRSAALPFAEPFRILSVVFSSRGLNSIYLILLSVGFGFIRYLQIQSTWT